MARNAKGVWSDIQVVVVTPRVVQDHDISVKYRAGWRHIEDARAFGGTRKRSNAPGVKATVTFTGRQLMFVTNRTPTRGVVEIYIDGTVRERLSLAGPAKPAWAARTYRWATTGTHTFAVMSPTNDRPADIDAFVTS
jgi:hypothetical protein